MWRSYPRKRQSEMREGIRDEGRRQEEGRRRDAVTSHGEAGGVLEQSVPMLGHTCDKLLETQTPPVTRN